MLFVVGPVARGSQSRDAFHSLLSLRLLRHPVVPRTVFLFQFLLLESRLLQDLATQSVLHVFLIGIRGALLPDFGGATLLPPARSVGVQYVLCQCLVQSRLLVLSHCARGYGTSFPCFHVYCFLCIMNFINIILLFIILIFKKQIKSIIIICHDNRPEIIYKGVATRHVSHRIFRVPSDLL